jgi:sugar (pentulose or hexulose) kinase
MSSMPSRTASTGFAGLGLGFWPDLESAIAAIVRVTRCYAPDPVRATAFNRTYQVFRELDDALTPFWGRL